MIFSIKVVEFFSSQFECW